MKIKKELCVCNTQSGTHLMVQIVRKYFEFKMKNKRLPKTLFLGVNQKKIIENDELLKLNLKNQNIEFVNLPTQLKYK